MITFIRTTSITPGKVDEALAFARAAVKLIHAKIGMQVEVNVPIAGDPYRLAFFTIFENLADYEKRMSKLVADPDWQKLLAANAGNFLPGAAHDEIWRAVL
jgi:NIPSNAP